MKKIATYIILILFVWFFIHSIIIVIDGMTDERGKSDFGVILGNKVNEDGTLSERLIKRLDKGIDLYNDTIIGYIVVSGGLGKEGFYEGTKMAEYLVEKGIPTEKIIIDDSGTTTAATAANFRKMDLKVNSVTVISQYHHISRTKLAFAKQGFDDVKGVHADYYEIKDFYSIIREFFGYYKYLIH